MSRVWNCVDKVICDLEAQLPPLEQFKDSFRHLDFDRDRYFYYYEYCADCGGLCSVTSRKLMRLRSLAQRLDYVSHSLFQILTAKCSAGR